MGRQRDPELVQLTSRVLEELNSLPPMDHEHAVGELVAAAVASVRTETTAPLQSFLERLVASVRLRRDPMFEKMLADADHEVERDEPPMRISGQDLIASLRG